MQHQVLENPVKKQNSFTPLVIITAFMVTTYLTSNIMAVKIISIWGIALFDAGTITFPIAYMLGDVLTEIWGFKTARKVIFLTFACNLLLVAATSLGVILPAPDYMAPVNDAYATIFSYVPRILLASLVGFLGGELSNAWLMERLKLKTQGRFLWLRTIGSSLVGYIFDTVLFVLIAFWGTVTWQDLLSMILVQYVAKVLIEALAGTPLAYCLIGYLRKKVAL